MADVSASSSRRRLPPDTSSRCRVEKVTGTHDFEVANYSLLDGRTGVDKCVTSAPFTIGGATWMIQFYPDGVSTAGCCGCACGGAASAFVTICNGTTSAKAKYTLSLVDHRDGRPSRLWRRRASTAAYGWPHPASWGFAVFFRKPLLRFSRCLTADGRLTIRCELTVFAPPHTEDTSPAPAPPPELPGHLERALRDGRGTDVTFDVAGREFRAHRVLLAARSPVFDAQLFGPLAEKDTIRIDDTEPAIFEMLLRFVYTDALPEGCDAVAVAQHLLAAADRYGLDRLKLMCAEKLCKSIDASTVTSTLALADQHHCQELKEACIVFMSSPKVLGAVVATDEFKDLLASCPQLVLNGDLDRVSQFPTYHQVLSG